MSYFVSQNQDIMKVCGVTSAANVPDFDVNILSYYLLCGTFFCGWNIIGADLLDYKTVHTLPPDRQDAIFLLAHATFNFPTLFNKTIFLDDENKILPRNEINQFYKLEQVQTSLSVRAYVTISGLKKEIRKIMLCTREWIVKYYVEPLQRNESRIRRIVAADNRRTGNTLNVGKAMAAAFNKLIVSNKNNSTQHCEHCRGMNVVCDCKHGCPAKGESQCHVVHKLVTCDLCMIQGIVGKHYKCQECYDFNLCEDCYENRHHANGTHAFMLRARVGSTPVYIQPKRVFPSQSAGPTIVATRVTPHSHTMRHIDTAVPIAHAIVSPKFRAGQRSHLIGLVQKPEWNGREVLVKNDLGDGRVIVTFVGGGTNITVKAVNLEPAKEIGIPVNSLVEIHGFNSGCALNGQLGVVVGAATTGVNWNHVLVQLLNNESRILSLKPEKVRIVENVA